MESRQHELIPKFVGVIKYFYQVVDALNKEPSTELDRIAQETLQRIVNLANEIRQTKERLYDENIEKLVKAITGIGDAKSRYTANKKSLYSNMGAVSEKVLGVRGIIENDFSEIPPSGKSLDNTPSATPRNSEEYKSDSSTIGYDNRLDDNDEDESEDEYFRAGHRVEPAVLTLAFLGTDEHRTNPSILTVLNKAVRTNLYQSVHLIDGPGGAEADDKENPRLGTYDHTAKYDKETGKIHVEKHKRNRGAIGALSSKLAGQGLDDAVAETLSVVEAMMKAHKKPLTINMAGFSRGADNALRAANELSARYSRDELIINMFSIDDVPGPYRNNRGGMTATRARLVPGLVKNYEAVLMRDIEHNESRLPERLRRVAGGAFKVVDKAHLTFEDPSYTRQRYNLYQGTHSAPNYFYTPGNPGKQINTDIHHAAQLTWDRLFGFMATHGTSIDRTKVKYVAYLNNDESQPANIESDVSRLALYSKMAKEHSNNDNGRSFTKYESDYFLHGRGYIQDANHALLFQKFFPAFFDYFFQNKIDNTKWAQVAIEINLMLNPATESEKSLISSLGGSSFREKLFNHLGLMSPQAVLANPNPPKPQGIYLAARNFYRHDNELFSLWNAMQAVLHPVMVKMDNSISRDAAKNIYQSALHILESKKSEKEKSKALLQLASLEIARLDKTPSEFTQRMNAMLLNFGKGEIENPAHAPHIYVREQLLKYIAANKPRRGEPGHDIQIALAIVSLLPEVEHTVDATAFTPGLLQYFINEAQRHHQLLTKRDVNPSGNFDKQLRTILLNIPSQRLNSEQLENHNLARAFNAKLHGIVAERYAASNERDYAPPVDVDNESDDRWEEPEHGRIMDDDIFDNANDDISLEQQEAEQAAAEQNQEQTIQLNDKTKQNTGNPKPFPGYTLEKKKETGANNPGPYGGVYVNDNDQSKAMFKCDTFGSDVRVAKTLAEFIIGTILSQIMNKMHPDEKTDPTQKHGANKFVADVSLVRAAGSDADIDIYLKSNYIKNRLDDLWLYAYKRIYTRDAYKQLTANQKDLTNDQKAEFMERAKAMALERIKKRFGNSVDVDKPTGFLEAFFRMKRSDIVKIPSEILRDPKNSHLARQFCEMTVARIIMGDYGVHAGNYVMTDQGGIPFLAAIDFGAGFLNLKDNVVFFHRFGTGAHLHKNHLLEYDPALYKSIDMAKAMINVATSCIDKNFLEALAHTVIQSVNIPYSTNGIHKFCHRLGMDKKDYRQVKEKDQLVRVVADFVANKMTARCQSTLRQGYDLFLSHCFDKKSNAVALENPALVRMLETNPDLHLFIKTELMNYKCEFLDNDLKPMVIATLKAYESNLGRDKNKIAAKLAHYLDLSRNFAEDLQNISTKINSKIPAERIKATNMFIQMQDKYDSIMQSILAFYSDKSLHLIDKTIPIIDANFTAFKQTVAEIDRLWVEIPTQVNRRIESLMGAKPKATTQRTPVNQRTSEQGMFAHDSNDNDNNAPSKPEQVAKKGVKPNNSGTNND